MMKLIALTLLLIASLHGEGHFHHELHVSHRRQHAHHS